MVHIIKLGLGKKEPVKIMGCFLRSYIFTKQALGSELYFSTMFLCRWAPWKIQPQSFGVAAVEWKEPGFWRALRFNNVDAVWPRTSHADSLSPSFLICNREMKSPREDSCKDWKCYLQRSSSVPGTKWVFFFFKFLNSCYLTYSVIFVSGIQFSDSTLTLEQLVLITTRSGFLINDTYSSCLPRVENRITVLWGWENVQCMSLVFQWYFLYKDYYLL